MSAVRSISLSLLVLIIFVSGGFSQFYNIKNFKNQCMSYYYNSGCFSGATVIFIACDNQDPTQLWKILGNTNSSYLICANNNYCMSINYGYSSLCSYAYLTQKNPFDPSQQWKSLANNTITNVYLSTLGYGLCAQSVIGQYYGTVINYINMIGCYNIPPQIFSIKTYQVNAG